MSKFLKKTQSVSRFLSRRRKVLKKTQSVSRFLSRRRKVLKKTQSVSRFLSRRRKVLIVANWKCNPKSIREAISLFEKVKYGIRKLKNVEVVVCPPSCFLPLFKKSLNPILGGQDCFWEQSGAFTGEVSPVMLKDVGCKYVIIGHSERKFWRGETEEIINMKLKAAISSQLKPIFCVGETEEERNMDNTQNIIQVQLENGLKNISKKELENIIIAYEPVWAIGSGNPCPVDEAQTMGLLIRKIINHLYNRNVSENIRVLYGGSVNSKNSADYVKEARLQGLLVGGASLDAKEFIEIVKAVSQT
jgi:triosephosphate isomerase